MKATKKEMAKFTTQELIDYVESMEDKYRSAAPYAQKLRLSSHSRNVNGICYEIQKSQMEASSLGQPYPVFK